MISEHTSLVLDNIGKRDETNWTDSLQLELESLASIIHIVLKSELD